MVGSTRSIESWWRIAAEIVGMVRDSARAFDWLEARYRADASDFGVDLTLVLREEARPNQLWVHAERITVPPWGDSITDSRVADEAFDEVYDGPALSCRRGAVGFGGVRAETLCGASWDDARPLEEQWGGLTRIL